MIHASRFYPWICLIGILILVSYEYWTISDQPKLQLQYVSTRIPSNLLFYAHPRNDSPQMQVRVFAPFCLKRVDQNIHAFVIEDLKCRSDFGDTKCLKNEIEMFAKEARMNDFIGNVQVLPGIDRDAVNWINGTTMFSTIGQDCHNYWHFFNRAA